MGLLLYSILGGGGLGEGEGGLAGILPLLLLTNSSILSGSDSLLTILLLSGGLGGAVGGAAPDMNMLLPLILKDSLNDTKDLLLVMMMSQAQPGSVIDGATGLTVAPDSGLNQILPFLLLKDSGSDSLTMILLLNMLSQQAPAGTTLG